MVSEQSLAVSYKDSGANAAYHALDKLALHDLDYVAHMCQRISLAAQGDSISVTFSSGELLEGPLRPDFKGGVVWQGRCLDLERAYRQAPVLGSQLRYARGVEIFRIELTFLRSWSYTRF